MPVRTSQSHPLQIANIDAPHGGVIGVTFCPGKHQVDGMTGEWRRELTRDVLCIADWGASAVLTLVEDSELQELNVPKLGTEIADAGMIWFHLPIRDYHTPSAAFEILWAEAGPKLHAILDGGGKVLVHCKGGLGRAGTIAARLLVERGMSPDSAITEVRAVRSGAIETRAQEAYVCSLAPVSRASRISISLRDRLKGCLLAGACGDALGAPVEFDTLRHIQTEYGPDGITDFAPAFGRIGAITDDTQMTMFTLEGLLRARIRHAHRGISHPLTMIKMAYDRWYRTQTEAFDAHALPKDAGLLLQTSALWSRRAPGTTCLSSLRATTLEEFKADNDSKGCGGVMRVAPISFFADDPFTLACDAAALTHGHPTGSVAAGALALLIQHITKHGALDEALDAVEIRVGAERHHLETLDALRRARDLARRDLPGIPYQLGPHANGGGWIAEEALAIAVYACLKEADPRQALVLAVNHNGDSDSTGSIAGNILGALHGYKWLPPEWLTKLELADLIGTMADDAATILDQGAEAEEFWFKYPGY